MLWRAKRRSLTPEEAGFLLAQLPAPWWDHLVVLLGTGLRFGELGGLRQGRAHLDAQPPVLQVVTTRYQAGKFGSGFKPRPKSTAGIRAVPLAPQVAEAIRRQLPPGTDPDALLFTDPTSDGARRPLSRYLFRHVYHGAARRLHDPAHSLPLAARRVLTALRADGPQTLAQLSERFRRPGGKLRPATIQEALGTLNVARVVARTAGEPVRWSAVSADQETRFPHLDLHGPHDLRHTFATWLEDAGIPDRVIDEVMGHDNSSRARQLGASRTGMGYRDTTPEMATRVVAAIQTRLAVVLKVAIREAVR